MKYTSLSLLHNRLGHRAIRTLLAADEHNVWHDTKIRMEPESECVTCQIATIRITNRNKHPHTPSGHPSATVFMDVVYCKSSPGLTPKTSHTHCLILVDAFSRFSVIYGLPNKSTESVVQAIKEYSAAFPMADKYGFIDIDRIKADAGPEFASDDFQQFYIKNRINLLLAAPKRQDSNHLAERSWQTIHRMARSMLLVKNLYNSEGERCSPFELFIGTKPTISHLRVFGCPVVAKRSVITIDDLTTKHCTE